MAPVVPDPRTIRAFESERAFEAWLSENHATETELWLKIYKKASGRPTVTYAEALDVALCWGWIDGLKKSLDGESFLQRFTPRKGRSLWSQINREHVARLTAAGRMTEHGQRHVDAAKADGRWDAAYASASTMAMPADFEEAVARSPEARAFYATLDKANRYAIAFRLANLKTAEGRAKRIASFVEMLARGEALHPAKAAAPAQTEGRPRKKRA